MGNSFDTTSASRGWNAIPFVGVRSTDFHVDGRSSLEQQRLDGSSATDRGCDRKVPQLRRLEPKRDFKTDRFGNNRSQEKQQELV